MSEHPQPHATDLTRSAWQSSLPADYTVSPPPLHIRGATALICPECGEPVGDGETQCEGCGESLARPPKVIRCVHCATSASSALTVCPGCGREFRAAPPHLLRYGAPALAACVLLVLLSLVWTRLSPLNWARNNLARGVLLVEDIGASLEPEMVIVMTPIVMTPMAEAFAYGPAPTLVPLAEPTGAGEGGAQSGEPQVVALAAPAVSAAAAGDAVNATGDAQSPPTPTGELPLGVGGPSSAQTAAAVEATPVVEDEVVIPTATLPPTSTPAPPATATSAPVNAASENGTARVGALGAIGISQDAPTRAPTPTWTPLATPTAQLPEGGIAQVAGIAQEDPLTPTPTAVLLSLPAPTATATPVVYQVRAGDTLVSIAVRYDVTVEALMEANAIGARDVYVIQPGQLLVVPLLPTPAPDVAASLAPEVRLEAPTLTEPVDGASIQCAADNVLRWERVQLVKDSDKYLLHVGFVSGPPTGDMETITWVLAQMRPVTETSWEMDPSLCDLAPAGYDNQWRWWVEVIEADGDAQVAVSPPSAVRRFQWE